MTLTEKDLNAITDTLVLSRATLGKISQSVFLLLFIISSELCWLLSSVAGFLNLVAAGGAMVFRPDYSVTCVLHLKFRD